MTFNWNTKKLVTAIILFLVSCDVSLLFAAQTDDKNIALQQQQLQQVTQLQQQLQAASAKPVTSAPQQLAAATSTSTNNNQNSDPTSATSTQLPQLPPPQGATALAPMAPAPIAPPPPAPTQSSAPPATPGSVSVQDINNSAFNSMTQNMLPMTPDQIVRLRQLFDQSQAAAAVLPNVPARGVISSQFVNLAPGTTPPVIRLQQGMVAVLTFLDSTGAPWPIQAYDIGNPSAFNIQWNKSDNTLMFQPLTPYPYGNMAIMLQGLSTPLVLTLTAGQKVFDARLDLHVQGLGPNAQAAPTGSGLPNGADPDLLGVLDGAPPTGSTVLQVSGGACEAWLSNGRLFVRTRYTLLSPGWLSTMSSADGMHAYELPKAPLLLVMQNGKIVQLKIEGL